MKTKLRNLPPMITSIDTRIAKPAPKAADPFYLSGPWRALVQALIKQRGRRCQRCGRTHNPDGSAVRIFGDHIVELRDGGAALDPANVMLLDGKCHSLKTAQARARRMAATPESAGRAAVLPGTDR